MDRCMSIISKLLHLDFKNEPENYTLKLKLRNDKDYDGNITDFVNNNNYSSITQFLIYVDLSNFKFNIFKGTKNNWKLDKSYLCTIGKNSTPTPSGVFKIGVKGLYFGVEKGYKCWYYSSFKGNYLFHSIIYNIDETVRDGRLAMKLSNGCIRLLKNNAKYIYDNVPKDTKVIIN